MCSAIVCFLLANIFVGIVISDFKTGSCCGCFFIAARYIMLIERCSLLMSLLISTYLSCSFSLRCLMIVSSGVSWSSLKIVMGRTMFLLYVARFVMCGWLLMVC